MDTCIKMDNLRNIVLDDRINGKDMKYNTMC